MSEREYDHHALRFESGTNISILASDLSYLGLVGSKLLGLFLGFSYSVDIILLVILAT